MKRPWIYWLALVVPLWVVMILCTHWEPIVRDSWGHTYWHIWNDVTPSSIATFAKDSWLGSNPRLGQTLTLLVFTPGPYHEIVTPIVELLMFWLLAVLALGRAPSVRRADDALVAATVIALVLLCTPQIGPMLFYRPFTGNYLYGFTLGLIWLVPYRVGKVGRAITPVMLVLGALAGFCNEHTGLAFLGMAALAVVEAWRSGTGVRPWMIVGIVGFLAGYIALLVAPGQDVRYNALALEAGILDRIVERGFGGNLHIVVMLGFYLLPALAWLALGLVERRRGGPVATSRALAVLALGGLACTVTLLASPKLGPRLYLASVALIAAAIAGWVCPQLRARWARTLCAVAAAGAIGYAGVRCLVTYQSTGAVSAERQRRIHDAIGSKRAITVPRYTIAKGHWFLGDDFAETPSLRKAVAADYGIDTIELED